MGTKLTPTTHDSIPSGERSTNPPANRWKVIKKLSIKFLQRWAITAIVCVAFVVVLKVYYNKDYLQPASTRNYNAITSTLTICLSLNLDSSLDEFASVLKWAILTRRPFPYHIIELILSFGGSNFSSLKILFHREGVDWRLRRDCISWIIVMLAAQAAIALVGITFWTHPLIPGDPNSPKQYGNVTTAIYTQIGPIYSETGSLLTGTEIGLSNLAVQRSNAFDYGVSAIGSLVVDAGNLNSYNPRLSKFNETSGAYVSPIANFPDDYPIDWTVGRTVDTRADCVDLSSNLDTSSNTTTVTFEGQDGRHAFFIPQSPLDYITYISDTSLSCGARCTQVYVIMYEGGGGTTDMFLCNNTVSQMYNWPDRDLTTNPERKMPDTQAGILAGAIGWGDIEVNSTLDTQPNRFQASSFVNGSYWALHSNFDNSTVARYLVAHFTAAAIGAISEYGIFQDFDDMEIPSLASKLDVEWESTIIILALIPSFQGFLALVCIYIAYRHKIPAHDDTSLASALRLHKVVENKTGLKDKIDKKTVLKFIYDTTLDQLTNPLN
ncbi:uncharacterized protein F4822DRAFT_374591 [Hypoxylon trugodes]|uniref:uncharacterized protein n=1 Tax=Hypoxylon trugodes TaxID=326681 RepID=UPI00218D22F1|nr:uncharacterized protein F4822DRAFT_374591 [Hypoxylon trugodes]KAI1384838.1 hypothetical protein F4822DRAFT_374591 [Hypoxylon trugodes]